ncbi:MAG: cell division protein FtsQ/DivIB [Alphaproteobacteria bacterium]|nr:cell division protein FtsQ/DivIB [Alphaproteobacteria bacterium]
MLQYKRRKSIRSVFNHILLILIPVLLITGFVYKNDIVQYCNVLSNKIVDMTGAHIKTLIVIGASPKVEKLIKANLGVKIGDSIFKLSTTKILNNLMNIGWIKDVSVHKILPNIIKIIVKERVPIAIYYHNKSYTLIDKEGKFIEDVTTNPNLPLVSGADANHHVFKLLQILDKYPRIKKEIHSIMYVRQRRWNIVLNNKITVKLPSYNSEFITKSLNTLVKLLKQHNIQNSVVSIDLRIPDNVIIQGLQPKTSIKNDKK